MEHFILIDKNNNQIIKEVKNLFNINKEKELDSRVILYLNETLDDIKHTIKALIDDLMTLDKIYISGSKLNLNKVMLVCETNNLHSSKTIEALGGILERKEIDPNDGLLTSYYWIDINLSINKYKETYKNNIY